MNQLVSATHIHFIGIKGWGMTALAQVLHHQGKIVTGSDVPEVFLTDAILETLQIQFHNEFAVQNIPANTDLVIASAAWGEENIEIQEAKKRNIPLLTYPEALGLLSQLKKSIGIAGTHGKTTTTALLSLALADLGLDPLAIVGSQVPQFNNTNARIGQGECFVAETCEYRRHFLNFHPYGLIITNIEHDHVDYFKDLNDTISAFEEYTGRLPSDGILVVCIDSPGVQKLLSRITREDLQILTYGESAEANFQLINHTVSSGMQTFQVMISNQPHVFEMMIPGKHNCLNAVAVMAMTYSLCTDKDPEQVISHLQKTIKSFSSTTRRLQRLGMYKNTLIYDDFGHHPTEIRVTLKALKDFYPDRKLIVSFMPHTYSRTAVLMDDFAQAFGDADKVLINEIYASARETPLANITGEALAEKIGQYHPNVQYLSVDDLINHIDATSNENNLFLTIGAGDNWKKSYSLLKLL